MNSNFACFECDGEYNEKMEDVQTIFGIIKNVPLLVCAKCGDKVSDDKGSRFLDEEKIKLGWKPRK